jgi:hypothetical protein
MLVSNLFKSCLKMGTQSCFSTAAKAVSLKKGQISQVLLFLMQVIGAVVDVQFEG